MKHLIDTTTLEPKTAPQKQNELVEGIWNERTWGYSPSNRYIAQHYTREQVIEADGICRAISASSPINLHYIDIIGKTREEIQALFESKLARRNRSAGARSLSRKYGKEEAEQIIKNHTGRSISLKS